MAVRNISREVAQAIIDLLGMVFVGAAAAALDFPSIAANTTADLTITVTGAGLDDTVLASGFGNVGALTAGLTYSAFVSSANTVTIRLANSTVGAIDLTSRTFTVQVMRRAA